MFKSEPDFLFETAPVPPMQLNWEAMFSSLRVVRLYVCQRVSEPKLEKITGCLFGTLFLALRIQIPYHGGSQIGH